MLKAREYRYLSTTFFHAPDGTVLRIEGAALANYPALAMPALASSGLAAGPASNASLRPGAPVVTSGDAGATLRLIARCSR